MSKKDQKKEVSRHTDGEEKKKYEEPVFKSHSPLEIMSAWEDKSSELEF